MDASSFEEIQAMSNVSPHVDQTQAETGLKIKLQDQRHELPPTHEHLPSKFPSSMTPLCLHTHQNIRSDQVRYGKKTRILR